MLASLLGRSRHVFQLSKASLQALQGSYRGVIMYKIARSQEAAPHACKNLTGGDCMSCSHSLRY